MYSRGLASRLGYSCRVRLAEITRPVKLSVRNLSINRNVRSSLQSSSSFIDDSNPSTLKDKDQNFQKAPLQSSVSPSSKSDEDDAALQFDEDARIKAKIIFNSHLYEVDPEQIWIRHKLLKIKMAKKNEKEIREHGYPTMKSVVFKYLDENSEKRDDEVKSNENVQEQPDQEEEKRDDEVKSNEKVQEQPDQEEDVHFPFANITTPSTDGELPGPKKFLPRKIRIEKLVSLNSDKILREKIKNVMEKRWMSDYEYFKEGILESWQKMYGTPRKDIAVSKIPCGGCGAHFQCQEPSIPGYLPSEIFLDLSPYEFKLIICQRCHFLKNYEIALDVQVPPAEYPVVLDEISKRKGLIILIIDLLDMPCSIWPGIIKVIGEKKPVIVVGNKVDLLPGDHPGYINHIKQVLKNSLDNYGLGAIKLKNICLISARTGFGVEELITDLQKMWEYKGDVFLLGCTNVGKSSLFNCLLQSDMCKVQAADLVQRATTSQWPNTTLNLLKFPIMRPVGWKLEQRLQRLSDEKSTLHMEKRLRAIQLNRNHIYHMPSFMEFVGRTFLPPKDSQQNNKDVFNAKTKADNPKKLGLNEDDPVFKASRWCYDTPGVSHPDQILTLLTTEELLEVLPSSPLVPRTFRLRLGQSLFVGGLARVDFLDGEGNFIWLTLFASEKLPVTVVWTKDADEVYNYTLGTDVLKVPHCGESRLARWPGLKAAGRSYTLFSDKENRSGADLVLSSTGWVSVTTDPMKKVTLLPWTPEARGIHFRIPALLPFAVRFKGKRIPRTPMYSTRRSSTHDSSEEIPEANEN